MDLVRYCERFIEFLVDLEALLPTRRFFNTVLDDCHVLVRCNLSNLAKREEGKLFTQVSQTGCRLVGKRVLLVIKILFRYFYK